jgi:hypothetical protein
MRQYKNFILTLSLKKIYAYFFLNDFSKKSYFIYLKNLYFDFLLSKYPKLDKNNFDKNLNYLINFSEGDLTSTFHEVFEPDYNQDLDKYYKMYEKQIFLRFLQYSINTKLIRNKYADVYDFAIKKINKPLKILEVGGGVPHGLIFNTWKYGNKFCENLNYIEADMLHSEFVTWYCKFNSIPLNKKIFTASKTPTIEGLDFNFVFAKDIFEHLDNPGKLIDDLIVFNKNSETLLCLDLEHKGTVTTQHINPNLPIFKKKLVDNNFRVIKEFKEVHVWQKYS